MSNMEQELTWTEALPALLSILDGAGNASQRQHARNELARMAKQADGYAAMHRQLMQQMDDIAAALLNVPIGRQP